MDKVRKKKLDITITEIEVSKFGGIQTLLATKGVDAEKIKSLDSFKFDKKENSNLNPISGSIETISALIEHENIQLISYLTARPRELNDVTIDNLKRVHAPTANIINTCNPYVKSTEQKLVYLEKHVCSNYDAITVIIDDNIELIHLTHELKCNNFFGISALGPFRQYQLEEASRLNISERCFEWKNINSWILNLIEIRQGR